MRRASKIRTAISTGSLFLLAGLLFWSGYASAAACGKRADIVALLRQRHGERPTAMAMTADGKVIELWTHPDGPWTLLATTVNGYACIQATGYAPWEMLPLGDPV